MKQTIIFLYGIRRYGIPTPYTIFDQFPYGGYWLQPRQIVYNVYEQRKPSLESKKLSKRGERYFMEERNGRVVEIGAMDISNALVVNPTEDGAFDCIYCEIAGEGMPEKRACQLPMEAIRKLCQFQFISITIPERQDISSPLTLIAN